MLARCRNVRGGGVRMLWECGGDLEIQKPVQLTDAAEVEVQEQDAMTMTPCSGCCRSGTTAGHEARARFSAATRSRPSGGEGHFSEQVLRVACARPDNRTNGLVSFGSDVQYDP
jgi:hypothetical protein